MTTEHRTARAVAPAFLALLALGCSSCGGDDGASGDGGTETETGIGTDFDFGETTPCVNEPQPGQVCIPGGKYLMGCVPGDDECEENEKPLVAVTLSPFFIDREEATIGEVIDWINAIKDDPGIKEYSTGISLTNGPGLGEYRLWSTYWAWGVIDQGDAVSPVLRNDDGNYEFNEAADQECPAQGGINAAAGGFSWLGAKMYCEHKGMQLPTEAQWEAAARGQTTNEFPCGSNLDECWWGIYACCSEASSCSWAYSPETWCHCCAPFSAEHSSDCPSPFGVKGMYGNADEWTADYYTSDHSACADGCVDPQIPEAPSSAVGHVHKGGGVYGLDQSWLRISIRWDGEGDDGGGMSGVRCVRPDTPFVPPDAGMDGGK